MGNQEYYCGCLPKGQKCGTDALLPASANGCMKDAQHFSIHRGGFPSERQGFPVYVQPSYTHPRTGQHVDIRQIDGSMILTPYCCSNSVMQPRWSINVNWGIAVAPGMTKNIQLGGPSPEWFCGDCLPSGTFCGQHTYIYMEFNGR